MRRTIGRGAAAISLCLIVVGTGLAPAAEARPSPHVRSAVGTCSRDGAGDLRWVSWLYLGLLGRPAAVGEAAAWLPALQRGQTYQEVAHSIAHSDEALHRVLDSLFRELLGRRPRPDEAQAWIPVIRRHGATVAAVALAAGDEAYRKAGGTVPGWVAWAYRTISGRDVDDGGEAFWVPRLSGGASRTQLTAQLWDSGSRMQRRVDDIYRALLARPADPSGRAHWSTVARARGDGALAVELASTQGAWNAAQRAFGATSGSIPPPCPPANRWVPAPGTLVHDLNALPHLGPRLITLTFDDGPHPTWTPQILEVLRRHGVAATFFVVGNQAERHPDLLRRIVAEGHRVANHSWSHPDMRTRSEADQRQQIAGTTATIESVIGTGSVRCFRPPYGGYNAATLRAASSQGLATIMWSRDGQDWASPGVDRIVSGNLDIRWDGGRGVTVLHDGGLNRSQTVAALPAMIESLRAQGYRFVQIC